MSKKRSCSWSQNVLQSKNLNNKPIYETFKLQNPLEQQQPEQSKERKLHKTANTNKRYATSKDKYRGHSCMPNNTTRLTPAIRKNVTRTVHFNANSLWHPNSTEQPQQTQKSTEFKYSKDCQVDQNDKHNLHRNGKCSVKLLNLPNSQRQQYRKLQKNHFLQPCHHHLGKNNTHKAFNVSYEKQTLTIPRNIKDKCLSNQHILPKYDNNKRHHCRLRNDGGAYGENDYKMLQFSDVLPSVSSSLTQLPWFPQVSQHQELLLGMFEVLPPLFLLKSSTCEMLKPEIVPKYQYEKSCQLEAMKHQCHYHAMSPKSKMLHSLPEKRMEHINFNYDRVLKYLRSKSKISDRDVIFGNAYLLLSKHYGWENSRIEWLLKLEQEHLNHTKRKVNCNKC